MTQKACLFGRLGTRQIVRRSLLCAAVAGLFPVAAFAQEFPEANGVQVATGLCDTGQSRMAVQLTASVSPAAGPYRASKSAAILGGAPSKLDQMRMAQANGEVAGSQGNALSAVAEQAPQALQAIEVATAEASAACARVGASNMTAPAEPAFIPQNAILGTLSISISHSPFDNDWAAVNRKPATRAMRASLAATGALYSGDRVAQIEAVNRWVNGKIAYAEDSQIYGQSDYWASARETLRRRVGDCEDIAIAKLELLAALGIDKSQMRLVVARDLVRNADHAVLVVMVPEGALMLDNMTDRLLDARLPNDYRPIMSFSQNSKWIHGYAVQPAMPVRMASAEGFKPINMPMAVTVEEPISAPVAIAMLIAPSTLPTLL